MGRNNETGIYDNTRVVHIPYSALIFIVILNFYKIYNNFSHIWNGVLLYF